jgi:hypothetical protein
MPLSHMLSLIESIAAAPKVNIEIYLCDWLHNSDNEGRCFHFSGSMIFVSAKKL